MVYLVYSTCNLSPNTETRPLIFTNFTNLSRQNNLRQPLSQSRYNANALLIISKHTTLTSL